MTVGSEASVSAPSVVSPLAGVIPVIETPFTSTGQIDLDSFDRLAAHLVSTGIDGVMFPGFASEFAKLDSVERHDLIDVLVGRTRGLPSVPAVISIPDHSTTIAVREAEWAAHAGADAINILPPYFLSPPTDAILTHLAAILDAVPQLPVIVQLAPALTGSALSPDDLVALARSHENLAAVKVEATPPGRMVSRFASLDPALPCLVGYAGLFLPDALARGAVGVQPGCSFAELYVELWSLRDDDRDAFDRLHRRLLPWLLEWMQNAELIVQVEKTITMRRGLITSDFCRAPSYRLDAFEAASVDRFLTEFGPRLGVG